MKKTELAVLCGMIITIILTSVSSFADEYTGITDGIFRLHILANSDSEEDQSLKLAVRDEILANTAYLFEGRQSAGEAAETARLHLDEIQKAVESVIRKKGYSYPVKCEVTEMFFTARVYDGVTVPQGEYKALRITIGKAEGQNWWCVMFPPLCLPAVEADGVLSGYGLSKEEIDMMKHPKKYEAKFFIVEIYYKIFGKD